MEGNRRRLDISVGMVYINTIYAICNIKYVCFYKFRRFSIYRSIYFI